MNSGITTIGSYAFANCIHISELNLPDSVKRIESYAFYGCRGFRMLNLNDDLEYIGNYAFYGCDGLLSLVLNENLVTLSDRSFGSCANLSAARVPRSVTSFAKDSFYSCPKLTIYCYKDSAAHQAIKDTSYKFFLLDDHEHDYEITVETEATCTRGGSQVKTCKICGYNYIELVEPLGHDYQCVVTPPTCTERGYATHTCSRCQDSYIDNYTNPTGHIYGEWIIDTQATCQQEGSKHRLCTVCNHRDVDSIPKTDHDYTVEVVPPTCTEKGYTLYTCKTCGTSHKDNYTDATGHSYGEWIIDTEATCQQEGSKNRVCSKCGKQEVDTIPRTEHNYQDEIVAPTCTEKGYTLHTCTICGISHKDTYVDAKGHAFGEWIVDKEATVLNEGKKHHVCQVCGKTENATIDKEVVDINSNPNYGLAVFTVVNAQTKEPMANAGIFVSTETEGEATFFTDAEGHVQTVLPVGNHMISAYANGCLTRNLKIKVTSGTNNIPQIGLSSQKTYTAEVTHHLMDLDEIKEAGIDTSAADNQHVYKYELKLEFQPEIDWLSLFYYMGDTGEILGGGGSGVAPGCGGSGSSSHARTGIVWIPSGSSDGGHFYIPPTESEPATTIYPVSEHFYLIIRGEVRWLKEMFDVEMLVVNNSMTDTLENLNATLKIPEGLSLATMKETQQELSQELGTIAEGEQKSAHWYVRGDTAGSYNVGARLQGMIMPFEEPIDDYYEAQNPLHVWAGNALHLHFEFPDAAYYGEDYPITITLENVSDITLYNISHAVQIEQGMEIFYSDGTSKSRIERSQWETVGVKEFHPGDKLIIEASVNIFFKSELMEQKLQQWIGFVDDVEQLMNAFKMLKTAYNATESLINCVSGCSRALDGFVASAGTSADKVELFKQLHGKISGLMLSYSKSGNKTLDAAVKLANSGVSASLNAITDDPDEWLKNHSVNDIKKLIKNVESLENSIINNAGQSARFDIYDSIRTAISAIPVKFALKSVTMTEDENNTTSIPWSYSISNSGAHYFGVSNVSKYLSSIAKGAMAQIYESEMPGYLQLIPGLDDPFNKEEAISYVKATENEIAQFQAKGATGNVTFHSWVECKNPVQPLLLNNVQPKFNLLATPTSDFLLSCDNETATFENGVLTFTGDGVISVTPQSGYDGTLYIQDSDGNLYTYEMDVVPEHTCCATEEEIVIPPTAEYDGFAVKRCDTCGDVLEIIPLANEQLCSEHSFGEWKTDTEPTCTECGLRERSCTVCGHTEYETVDTVPHTFGEWQVTKPATCSEEGEESATCENCGEVTTRAIAKLAHTEGEWQIVKEATTTEEGEKQLVCSVCGEVLKTEAIPKMENGIVIGDVNGDDTVNADDVQLLTEYLNLEKALSNYQKISADINRDRNLNQDDVSLLTQYVNGDAAESHIGEFVNLSVLAGDVNGDGNTDIADATYIQMALAEYFDFTELDSIMADVNGDGKSDINDVTSLQRYLAKIEGNICVSQVKILPYSIITDYKLTLGVGESQKPNVKILPLGMIDCDLIWTSDDESVATVSSDGTVTAVGMGTAQITIKVENGPKATCNILVNENSDYTFVQNDDGTISITGYTGSDTSLTIPSTIYGKTVKSIAANAFKNNTQITNIEISNGISSIGESAFAYCSKLESVTLPGSVTEMGKNVMRDCVKLTQVNLSEELTVLPYYAFYNCKLLSQIELPSNLKEVGSCAFENCETLDNVTLPQGLTTIGAYAFDSCKKLSIISIPDSVISIENNAFGYCTSLTSIALPPEITTIADYLFNNSGIVSITIPNKVKKIEDNAFFSCSNLTSVNLSDSVKTIEYWAFAYCQKLKSFDFVGVQSVENNAFMESGIKELHIPAQMTYLESGAFARCLDLRTITVATDNTRFCAEDGILFSKDKRSIVLYPAAKQGSSYTIPDGVETIGNAAFSGAQIESVTLPDTITYIEGCAFESCNNLISFEFPHNTYSIPYGVFAGCEKLQYVAGTEQVNWVGSSAFGSCHALRVINLPNATTIENSAFRDCQNLSSVVLNDQAYVNFGAFSGCYSLRHLFKCSSNSGYYGHPSENPEVGWNVEYDNTPLLNANTCEGSRYDYSFSYAASSCDTNGSLSFYCNICHYSDSLAIESTFTHEYQAVSSVDATCTSGGYTVYRCIHCGNEYHGDETEALGHHFENNVCTRCDLSAFRYKVVSGTATITQYIGNESNVVIPSTLGGKNVTVIDEEAFGECDSVVSLTIPETVSTINYAAFNHCRSLQTIAIPDTVTSLGNSLFWGCTKLKNVTLPQNLKSIGRAMFKDCSSLTDITLPASLTSIGTEAFYQSGIKSITIPTGVIKLENYTFYGCNKLEGALDLNHVRSIGEQCFAYCSNVESIRALECTAIGNEAFESCSSLENALIPQAETIGENAFKSCTELTKFTLNPSLTKLENGIFLGCVKLDNVTIPDRVTEIGNNAFWLCVGMKNIHIGSNVKTIGYNAFTGCSSLENIYIPRNVTTLGERAFAYCKNLKSIVFSTSTLSIANKAFENCDSLEHVLLATGSDCWDQYTIGTQNDSLTNATRHCGSIHEESTFTECGKEFEVTESCSVCGYVIGHRTDKLEHCYLAWNTVTPTCSRQGYTVYRCEYCGSEYTGDYTNPTGHSYRYHDHQDATCQHKGGDVYICDKCGDTYCDETEDMHHVFQNGKCIICGIDDPSAQVITGTTGDCNWSFNESTETLTISGNGSMGNYSSSSSIPWKNYSITNVVFEDGVTNIGERAFYNFTNLANVTISDTVKSIGEYVFYNCDGLTNVTIPDGVTSIGNYAFRDCSNLKTISFPASVTSIGECAFIYCSKLETIDLSNNIEYIGESAFSNTGWSSNHPDGPAYFGKILYKYFGQCPDEVVIKEGTTAITNSAFINRTTLKRVKLPNSLTEIPQEAFLGCTNLESVELSQSITTIKRLAFRTCTNLKQIIIPSNVTVIEEMALGYINTTEKVEGFTIYGEPNTAAETYANDNGFSFNGN